MVDPKSKLDALEALLGVDDTEEVVRPAPRRSVGEILGEPGSPSSRAPQTIPEQSEAGPREAAAPPSSPRPVLERRVDRRRPERRQSEPKVRTSSLLPASYTERFERARERRWDFPRLVESALSRAPVAEVDAEAVLDRHEAEQRALRSFSLGESVMGVLDELGDRWRMNRSQVLTVLLEREFDELGF